MIIWSSPKLIPLRKNSLAILTNPFYHAWKAGAIQSESKILWLNAKQENNYIPNIENLKIETLFKGALLISGFSPPLLAATTSTLSSPSKSAKKTLINEPLLSVISGIVLSHLDVRCFKVGLRK